MMGLSLLVIGFLVSYIFTPRVLGMLSDGQLSRTNFQGKIIPSAAGVIFSAVLTVVYFLFSLNGRMSMEPYLYLGFLALVTLAGLVDDVAGNREFRGFVGHFSCLWKESRLSTGLWKAGLVGVVAFLAAGTITVSPGDWIISGFLIALSANFFNLLDVRPGRSIKVFFFSTLMILLFLPSYNGDILLFPLLGIVAAYSIYDIQGQAMMGDAGANVIGLAVGFSLSAGGGIVVKTIILILLVVLHILSEFNSFSFWIKKNSMLNFLDQWGRRE